MLKTRVIPTLLYRDHGLVKGRQFDSRRVVGNPMQAISVYEMRGVDELIFFDVMATIRGDPPDFSLIDSLADSCFMPLTVGGGIRDLEHVRRLLDVGADKVCIGSAAVEDPDFVVQVASRFGSQCVVVAIDWRKSGPSGKPEVWSRSGTVRLGADPVETALTLESSGAGEIVATSIDRDGMMNGYDLGTTRRIAAAVTIPVIASGGAGRYNDFVDVVVEGGANAVAASSMFLFTEQTPREAKAALAAAGVPVRL
jgi:cyclase